MQNIEPYSESMTPQEAFDAVRNLKAKLEENFIQLGQLFSMIKRRKLYAKKGYQNFKDFVETEFQINSTLAGKLCSVYELYVDDLNLDDKSLKEIGFDRLNMVKPYVAKSAPQDTDNWLEMAENMPIGELKDHIKQLKEKEKETTKGLKDVLIDQYLQRMLEVFNCSRKELDYKLALYFQDVDLDEVKKTIRERQRDFELELGETKEDKQ